MNCQLNRSVLYAIIIVVLLALQWTTLRGGASQWLYYGQPERNAKGKNNTTRKMTNSTTTSFSTSPRTVVWDADGNDVAEMSETTRIKELEESDSDSHAYSDTSTAPAATSNDNCTLQEWQTTSFPNCNNMHELWSSPLQLQYLTKGSITNVYTIVTPQVTLVLKTHAWAYQNRELPVDDYAIDSRRKDAVFTERLTFSKLVPPIYGYCGISSLNPFADGGTLRQYVDYLRISGKAAQQTSLEKLIIATQIAMGVADLHSVGGNAPMLAHNDLYAKQFNYHEGIFQLNDFNHGQFLKTRVIENGTATTCKDIIEDDMNPAKFRAPEDLQYLYNKSVDNALRLDKADVYSLGHTILHVLTNIKFSKFLDRTIVALGRVNPVPAMYTQDKDPAIVSMVKAVRQCFLPAAERPSAQSIADGLLEALRNVTSNNNSTKFNYDTYRQRSIPKLQIDFEFRSKPKT